MHWIELAVVKLVPSGYGCSPVWLGIRCIIWTRMQTRDVWHHTHMMQQCHLLMTEPLPENTNTKYILGTERRSQDLEVRCSQCVCYCDHGWSSGWATVVLNRVDFGDVIYDLAESLLSCCPIPFPPHKFIQVRRELLCINSLHSFKFQFCLCPKWLHVLSVDSSGGVDKVQRMVDYLVCLDIW